MVSFEIKSAFRNYFNAITTLKELEVVKNQRDFTSNIGEWLVETLYDGKRSKIGNQKYWDVDTSIGKVQVKTHAKSSSTKARWSKIKNDQIADIDYVIIIVFNEHYELKEFYKIPWSECLNRFDLNKGTDTIYWNKIKEFKHEIDTLPKPEIISMFIGC
jgi:hypothetical protein